MTGKSSIFFEQPRDPSPFQPLVDAIGDGEGIKVTTVDGDGSKTYLPQEISFTVEGMNHSDDVKEYLVSIYIERDVYPISEGKIHVCVSDGRWEFSIDWVTERSWELEGVVKSTYATRFTQKV